MFKVNIVKIIVFLIVKYLVFFTLLAFLGDRFKLIVINNSNNTEELLSNSFYYLIYPLLITVLFTFLFSMPFYFSFRVKKVIYFVFLVIAVLLVEYFIYSEIASATDFKNGLYNGLLTLLFFVFFFSKEIVLKFKLAKL